MNLNIVITSRFCLISDISYIYRTISFFKKEISFKTENIVNYVCSIDLILESGQ